MIGTLEPRISHHHLHPAALVSSLHSLLLTLLTHCPRWASCLEPSVQGAVQTPPNTLRTWISGSTTIFAPTAPVPTQGLSPASPLPAVSMCFCTSPPSVPQPHLACPFTGRGKSPLREGLVRWLLPGTVASAPARGSPPGPKHPSAQVLLLGSPHRIPGSITAGDRPVWAAFPGQAICGPPAGSE